MPFFLLVGFTDPHRAAKGFANDAKYPPGVPAYSFDPKSLKLPYFIPDRPDARADYADYYQSVARLDDGVGRMMKVLEETKKLEETLVVFLSDNGIPFPGAKTTLYDAGLHLPLIVRKPGQKAGIVSSAMVSWTDVAPTILEWCGVKPPNGLPGKSFLPILEEENPKGWDEVYASHQFHEITMYYPMRSIRTRGYRYILNLAHELEYPQAGDLWNSDTWQGILKRGDRLVGDRTLEAYLHRHKEELYDLADDPHELKNLAGDASKVKVLDELRGKLAAWQKRTADPWLIKATHE